jgi:hypothetical protein
VPHEISGCEKSGLEDGALRENHVFAYPPKFYAFCCEHFTKSPRNMRCVSADPSLTPVFPAIEKKNTHRTMQTFAEWAMLRLRFRGPPKSSPRLDGPKTPLTSALSKTHTTIFNGYRRIFRQRIFSLASPSVHRVKRFYERKNEPHGKVTRRPTGGVLLSDLVTLIFQTESRRLPVPRATLEMKCIFEVSTDSAQI